MQDDRMKMIKPFIKVISSIIGLLLISFVKFPLSAQAFYWEEPTSITAVDSRFPTVVSNNTDSYVLWQEIDLSRNQIWISCRKYLNSLDYTEKLRFAGPFPYSGEIPDIYSAAINSEGVLVVSVLSGSQELSIYTINNSLESFIENKISTDNTLVAPRLYVASNDSFKLFTSFSIDNSFMISCIDSSDGKRWSSFKGVGKLDNLRNPFIPVLIPSGNKDILVFQSQYSSEVTRRLSYQLYSMVSTDNGRSWSDPSLITDSSSITPDEQYTFDHYQNQRPFLYKYNNETFIAWERTDVSNAAILVGKLSENGIVPNSTIIVSDQGNASRPVLFEYNGVLYVVWFDTRRGKESIYFAKYNGNYWSESTLIENNNSNMFPYPLVSSKDGSSKDLLFFFQEINVTKNRIDVLSPDITINKPSIRSISYILGKKSKQEDVEYRILFPEDSSGIKGYSYSWSENQFDVPPMEIQKVTRDSSVKLKAKNEGIFYFSVRITDFAGNWSEPVTVKYERDLSPPIPPSAIETAVDEYGMLSSNSFRVNWAASVSDDTMGYTYALSRIGDIPNKLASTKRHPLKLSEEEVINEINKIENDYNGYLSKDVKLSSSIITSNTSSVLFNSRANGVYLFSVAAIDEVGNVSKSYSTLLILNKFNPETFISSIKYENSNTGENLLSINGGGFTYDGTISEIYIDRDGKAPYDLTLKLKDGQFKVDSNIKISNLRFSSELDEGKYFVGLLHTDRGLYMTSTSVLTVSQNGTLKIEADYLPNPKYKNVEKDNRIIIRIEFILVFLLVVIIIVSIILLISTLVKDVSENKTVKQEVIFLLKGGRMALLKKHFIFKKREPSLSNKLIGFTILLVISIVTVITFQNGTNSSRLQSRTLSQGLQNRVDVLMESLSSSVKNFLPVENELELSALPAQKDAMTEIKYITIIGSNNVQTYEDINYVLATNDSDINSKIDSGEYVQGRVKISDDTILTISENLSNLGEEASVKFSNISKQLSDIWTQRSEISSSTDENDLKRQAELRLLDQNLRNELDSALREMEKKYSGSTPFFNIEKLDTKNTDYIFYRPVLYRQNENGEYKYKIIGIIIVELSTKSLVDEISNEVRNTILMAILLAVLVIILGSIGAWILSTLITKPIKKLEKHLVKVGSLMTQSVRERQRLEKEHIEIKSNDEIGRLGEVVNKMTKAAGESAFEEFLQQDGKYVQQQFVPLNDGEGGRKLPICKINNKDIDLFAYYEGDSAVSGDYFDYKKLDDKWYVFIKCDISGHGVPAALLVSVVATKFKEFYYFSSWTKDKNGINLKSFVSSVNDFIFELGTKGKFSTINISFYNSQTGELYICNAGDGLIHIFDSSTRKLNELKLSDTPTAGGFMSDLIEMKGGYKIEKVVLKKNDILYLYTDGIDEAERMMRNENFDVKQTKKEEVRFNRSTHKEETVEQILDLKEQFGQERITAIVEAVLNRKEFLLEKSENPIDEVLRFDFSNCEGTIDESILALAAIERVFRMVKYPDVQKDNQIEIYKMLDDFLRNTFNLYDKYCIPLENDNTENLSLQDIEKQQTLEDPNTTRYSFIQEDKQADDITMIAIKRN